MGIKQNVISLFEEEKELSVKEITDILNVSKQMIHLVVKSLIAENYIEKLGRTPKTIYRLLDTPTEADTALKIDLSISDIEFLENQFLVVTETGNMMSGLPAFTFWCKRRNLPIEKTISEFIKTKNKYEPYYESYGLIDGMGKLGNTKGYDQIWLDHLNYLDFYAIERFGKTKLGTLLHFAKQGQNKHLMSILLKEIKGRIHDFLKSTKIDAVGFVPPTIRREIQLMKFLQNQLKINLPILDIKKISGIIPVPQKSLTKLDERVSNADKTFAVTNQGTFQHVLLIDDAVGSGATLNQIAKKIKTKKVATQVTGMAVVGSFKGFDVITDV
ncbi:MAG: hypothetical protein GY816_18625 [Cytophagales bacterium]|nr:hypothetical protein [Cytophagales bacterium]